MVERMGKKFIMHSTSFVIWGWAVLIRIIITTLFIVLIDHKITFIIYNFNHFACIVHLVYTVDHEEFLCSSGILHLA